jgi:hypothetical protein
MEIQVNGFVAPGLHPGNVTSISGYDETTAPSVASALAAFTEAYTGLTAIHEARGAASKNTAWTKSQQTLAIANFGFERQQRILMKFDNARALLIRSIATAEESLQSPVQQLAGTGTINEEIRRHSKELPLDQRIQFLNDARAQGDTKTLTAILGAPPYLSGLSKEEHMAYLRTFHAMVNPAAVQRLSVMRSALDLIDARSSILFAQVEKALGSTWIEIDKLKQVNTAAQKALSINASNAA